MFDTFTTVNIQIELFWVVTLCSDVTGQSLHHEDRRKKVLRNVSILPRITQSHNPEDLYLNLKCTLNWTMFLINLSDVLIQVNRAY
jgi:hypothetical protein